MLVASTLIAIPIALLTTTFSTGTSPGVQQAIQYTSAPSDGSMIQQVAGSATTKSGVPLQSLAANRAPAHSQVHSSDQPRGILDGLFNRSSSPKPKSTPKAQAQAAKPVASDRAPANWNGIPYHQANKSTASESRTPIRDPNSSGSSSARIVRNGSVSKGNTSASTTARETSSRTTTSPTLARIPTPRSETRETTETPIKTVPREVAKLTTTETQSLSSETSSRRSGRRTLDTLDPAEINFPSKTVTKSTTSSASTPASSTPDLVPRFVRRSVEESEDSRNGSGSGNGSTSGTGAGAVNPPTVAAANKTPTPSGELSQTAPATLGVPTTGQPTISATPIVQTPKVAASNTTTPSQSVSHRAGPPATAFGSNESVPAADEYIASNSGQNQSQGTATSQITTPVGSGIAKSNDDPYLTEINNDSFASRTSRMTTYGQPVQQPAATNALASPAPASPRGNSVLGTSQLHDTANYGPGRAEQSQPETQYDNRMRSSQESSSSVASTDSQRQLLPGQNSTTSELPGIRVVTFGPSEIMIRQTQEYEIRVENRGSIDAEGVMVRAMIPDWAEMQGHNATQGTIDNEEPKAKSERLVWKIDSLPAGSVERMFVRLRAERSGTHDLDVDWTLLPQRTIAQVKVHEPRLDLTIEGPDEVIYGQSQTYTVRVLNPGDGTAPNVVFTLSPNSATPQTQRIGDIPAGKEAQFEVELTAQDLVDLKIHGLAAGDLDLRAEAEKTIHVSAAKLEAVLTGPEAKYQNTESLYSLQVQNSGTATSERITATLRLPGGVKYLGGLEEAKQESGALRWTINALAPGASRNYQFRCNMTATGDQKFAFDCKGTAAGQTAVSLATRVESIADLVLTISDPPAPAPIDSDVVYEIILRNRGSKDAVDVRALAQFSHGIEPNKIEGQSGEMLTGQVLFDAIPRIGAGQEVRLKVVAKAERAGHHRFRAEVHSGDTILVAEEATHYMSAQSDRVSRRSTDAQSR